MAAQDKPFRPGKRGRPPKNSRARIGLAEHRLGKAEKQIAEARKAIKEAKEEA